MNETKTSCAPADSRNLTWDGMDWSKCEAYVRKLQARIVKAQKEGRHNKVKALQWTLTHSFYAKALAVKRVTSNKGKKTSGVDKQLWDSPKRKYKAIDELKRRGYKPQPLRKGSYQEKERQTSTVGNTDNERQSDASIIPNGFGTDSRNDRRPFFLWFPQETQDNGRYPSD